MKDVHPYKKKAPLESVKESEQPRAPSPDGLADFDFAVVTRHPIYKKHLDTIQGTLAEEQFQSPTATDALFRRIFGSKSWGLADVIRLQKKHGHQIVKYALILTGVIDPSKPSLALTKHILSELVQRIPRPDAPRHQPAPTGGGAARPDDDEPLTEAELARLDPVYRRIIEEGADPKRAGQTIQVGSLFAVSQPNGTDQADDQATEEPAPTKLCPTHNFPMIRNGEVFDGWFCAKCALDNPEPIPED